MKCNLGNSTSNSLYSVYANDLFVASIQQQDQAKKSQNTIASFPASS